MTLDSERRSPLQHRNRWGFGTGERPSIDLRRPEPPARSVELSAEPAPVTFDPARAALVVVDLQNDFCAAGGWLASIGVDVSVLRPAMNEAASPRGRKPTNWYRSPRSPDATSAVSTAEAPGSTVTSTPAASAARTIRAPGSDTPGMPASETSAMRSPASSRGSNSDVRDASLCSW